MINSKKTIPFLIVYPCAVPRYGIKYFDSQPRVIEQIVMVVNFFNYSLALNSAGIKDPILSNVHLFKLFRLCSKN